MMCAADKQITAVCGKTAFGKGLRINDFMVLSPFLTEESGSELMHRRVGGNDFDMTDAEAAEMLCRDDCRIERVQRNGGKLPVQ